MGQPLSIENEDWVCFITSRTAGSRLWFINNRLMEQLILAALARYQERYGVILYSFILMGNHYHIIARFPGRNRALFMRDFNAALARLVKRFGGTDGRRSVWARRYSFQVLPRNEDIEHYFFYAALNPISSGLVSKVSQYPSFNSFSDAIRGVTRKYRWVEWSRYLMARRHNKSLKPSDFEVEHTLKFSKLPGYEHLSPEEYVRRFSALLPKHEEEVRSERLRSGRGFLGASKLLKQSAGDQPRQTKQSTRYSLRPLVLTACKETRRKFLKMYFAIRALYDQVSYEYRNKRNSVVVFPSGTYPPPRLLPA